MENKADYSVNVLKEIESAKQKGLNHLNNPDGLGYDEWWWKQLPEEFQEQWQTLSLDMRAALFVHCCIVADRGDRQMDVF